MRIICSILLFIFCQTLPGQFTPAYPGQDDVFPFAPAAGQVGSTAVAKDDPAIVAWATGFTNVIYGAGVASQWQTPVNALGPAVGDSFDVVSLGSGGEITLTFSQAIRDGDGPDFAVFENSFSDTFLELAWVEVSTDGIHFIRFPNFSYTEEPTGSIDATHIHGLAGKYRQGYGTPFDLQQLQLAYAAVLNGTDSFAPDYRQSLLENFSEVDLDEIRYVRILDVVGDGNHLDAQGFPIYDPYPTSGSAGFDLEAIAVIHQAELSGIPQTIDFTEIGNQRFSDGSLQLEAVSSSGLPVSYDILEGPATLEGNTLYFTGLGQVVVRALQAGNESYAPASSVPRSFYIADELQHLYFEPVANQLTNTSVRLHAATSSGLTPMIEVVSGPFDVSAGFPPNQVLQAGATAGTVVLRAYQNGGSIGGVTYAPANEVFMMLELLAPGAVDAPQSFADWQAANEIAGPIFLDSDADGANDFEEYVAGTDPRDGSERPIYLFERAKEADGYILEAIISRLAPVRVRVQANSDLSEPSGWVDVVPEVLENAPISSAHRKLRLRVSGGDEARKFWRFQFDQN
ncbi:MAG: hypothetical protein ACNA77_02920 [Opitutales bacterium]